MQVFGCNCGNEIMHMEYWQLRNGLQDPTILSLFKLQPRVFSQLQILPNCRRDSYSKAITPFPDNNLHRVLLK